jgi:hypothetical protein
MNNAGSGTGETCSEEHRNAAWPTACIDVDQPVLVASAAYAISLAFQNMFANHVIAPRLAFDWSVYPEVFPD